MTSAFFDELTTVLESLVLQSGPVIVGGDINIHVDDAADADAARLAALFDAFGEGGGLEYEMKKVWPPWPPHS